MSQGSLAAGLFRIYDYMIRQLVNANLEGNTGKVEEVIRMLTELKDTWLLAMKQANSEPAAAAALPNRTDVPENGYLSIIG